MKYIELQKIFREQDIFSPGEIKTIEPGFFRARLNEWQNKGYIKKLLRGYYYFTDKKFDERALYRIANRIYSPSCISLESALSYYGLILERPLAITSISTKKTNLFKTPLATFHYRKMKPELFFGYIADGEVKDTFLIASPEKALADYFYLNPQQASIDSLYEMRFDMKNLKMLTNKKKMIDMAEKFKDKAVIRAIKYLWRIR